MSEDAQEPLTQEQIERWEKRTFARLRKELRPALDAVLSNTDGMARLLATSDEEWQAAVDAEGEQQEGQVYFLPYEGDEGGGVRLGKSEQNQDGD